MKYLDRVGATLIITIVLFIVSFPFLPVFFMPCGPNLCIFRGPVSIIQFLLGMYVYHDNTYMDRSLSIDTPSANIIFIEALVICFGIGLILSEVYRTKIKK